MLGTFSKKQENKIFTCTTIAFQGQELIYMYMQYSIFVKLEYVPTNIEYMAPRNDSWRYDPNTSRGVIHYIEGFQSDYQHITSLLAPLMQKITLSVTVLNYFYISITQEMNCKLNVMGKMNVIFSTTKLLVYKSTKTVIVANHMYFNAPFVYFNTMYRVMDITCIYLPGCEVVVSYTLVSVRKVDKHQEDCLQGYYKVRH